MRQVTRIRRFRALQADAAGNVWGFRRQHLVRFSPPYGESDKVTIGTLPFWWHRLASFRPAWERLARCAVYRMERTPPGSFICAGPRGILRLGPGETRFRQVFHDFHGRRPISLCQDEHGGLYFGEYFSNPQRIPVRIFYSENDGLNWQLIHEFPAGQIRHVHGLEYDPHRQGIWVLTGDEGDEAIIGWATPRFRTFQVVLQADQQSRACSGICTPDSFLFGTDAPHEQNHVYQLDPATATVEPVAAVDHSVFFATQACGGYWMSTVVEPSNFNTTQAVHVYFSRTGQDWSEVECYQWDQRNLKLFQYPSAFLAKSPLDAEHVYLSFVGRQGWDGDCLVGSLADPPR